MNINPGDLVTWRSGKSKVKDIVPIGIVGCRVVQLGEGPSGEPCAQLTLPERMQRSPHLCNLGIDPLEPVWTLLADLEKD